MCGHKKHFSLGGFEKNNSDSYFKFIRQVAHFSQPCGIRDFLPSKEELNSVLNDADRLWLVSALG